MMNTEKLESLATILKNNLPFDNHSMIIIKNEDNELYHDILPSQSIMLSYDEDEIVATIKLDNYYWQDTLDTFNCQSFDEITVDECKNIIDNEIMYQSDRF